MIVKLKEYTQKRNFDKTLEPQGEMSEPHSELKFVIQHHMARREHYDLRLEWDGVLLSWAVPKGPSYDTRDKRLAVQVEEHPLEYRNFEGTIPKGEYGGGIVMLWDEGTWEPYDDVNAGLSKGALKFVLKGKRLKGKWALIRLKEKAGETKSNWLLLKEKDEYTQLSDGISGFNTSIRTARTMQEIEQGEENKFTKNPISCVDVQLAKLVHTIPEGDDWLYEIKYDGYRILAYVECNLVRLITRNGFDYTSRFQGIAASLVDWANGRAMILDGEMVITDEDGKTDFQALQNYFRDSKKKNPTYIIFDLLALDGVDLRGQSLLYRKDALEALIKDAPKNLYYSKHIRGNGKESFVAACNANLEGIIGKKADSVYSGARNGDWIKLKCYKRQEFVIGGYTLSDKKTSGISSLMLGLYSDEGFVYAGRAGTGLSESDVKELKLKFECLKRIDCPFIITPKPKSNEIITWLKPKLVAEIQFAEWTEDNLLRQASFKGLRIDKDARDIVQEKVQEKAYKEIPPQLYDNELEKPMESNKSGIIVEGIKITSPDKVMFDEPRITKEDIARYYAQVSKRMLPYVDHRILSIVRCPKGTSGSSFFKKHPGLDSKEVVTISILSSSGEAKDYFYIKDVSGLVSEAQMCTIEFHIWGSRVNELEKPDMMVFDLDPDEGMDLNTVRQGVLDLKSILDELSLKSYLKTSGGKGYHVVVPLNPVASWDAFNDFAKRIAQVMEKKWPDRYTSNVRKVKRTNKIFIDWIRNGRGATSIAPYSLRARKSATVSMPIAWDELDVVSPDSIDMHEAIKRIGYDDPWKDFFQNNQMLVVR